MQSGWLHEFGKGQTEGEKESAHESTPAGDGVSRRGFLHGGLVAGAAAGAVAAQGLAGTRVAQAQQPAAGGAQTPIGAPWWPSRWGPQDEAGASNWITPTKVLAAARLIKTDKQPCVVGADCWAVEVVPNPNADLAFVVHNELITRNGIFLHENLDLSALAADRVHEFVYVFTPLRIKGATGSPGRPIAIV